LFTFVPPSSILSCGFDRARIELNIRIASNPAMLIIRWELNSAFLFLFLFFFPDTTKFIKVFHELAYRAESAFVTVQLSVCH